MIDSSFGPQINIISEVVKNKKEIILVLHNIRSSHNVGSIFRTADAGGVSKIIISGYSPLPVDKFERKSKEISKVALGAEEVVPWCFESDIHSALLKYKREGYKILALEQDVGSMPYDKLPSFSKVIIVLGNEVGGVSSEILKLCDFVAEIPMYGKKESLNVGVATGILLFEIIKV